jgi:surfeit locus 1 family protein
VSEPAGKHKRTSSGFPWLLIAFVLPALAVLVLLGNWQVQRLEWKEGLLATIQVRLDAAPVPAGEIARLVIDGGDIRYRPASASGTFDHANEQHFFATHKGASGYYVYTPLVMDYGRMLLVNRGFVPFDLKNPAARAEGQVEGPVTVTGLARERLGEKPSFIVPDNDVAGNIYYWKDWSAMVDQTGYGPGAVLPFFLDADDTPNPGGWPVGGVTRIDLPNNHLQYAVTWYGLALVLVVVTGLFGWRRMRSSG